MFRLVPGSKRPFKGSTGFKDATTDDEAIRAWWAGEPDANIGLATGKNAGFFVLDVDIGDGKQGGKTLAALTKPHGDLPKTYTVKTPRGGRHYYFAWPGDRTIRNSEGRLGNGLDIRGDGGYVVAPPSVFDNKPYKVVNGSGLAPAPNWLIELIGSAKESGDAQPQPDRCEQRRTEAASLGFASPRPASGRVSPLRPASTGICSLPCASVRPEGIDEIVAAAVPKSRGQNNKAHWKLARALKALELRPEGLSQAKVVEAFDQWFAQAEAGGVIQEGEGRDFHLSKFLYAYRRVKHPAGVNATVVEACKKAKEEPQPPQCESFKSAECKLLCAICYHLDGLTQAQGTAEPWYLSGRTAGRLIGVSGETASTYLQLMVQLGVLQVVRKHTTLKATRYRWGSSLAGQPAGQWQGSACEAAQQQKGPT